MSSNTSKKKKINSIENNKKIHWIKFLNDIQNYQK